MPKREKWTERLKRSVKELVGGRKTYLPKKKKEMKTTRTSAVEHGLKQAGVSGKKIKKLRGKY